MNLKRYASWISRRRCNVKYILCIAVYTIMLCSWLKKTPSRNIVIEINRCNESLLLRNSSYAFQPRLRYGNVQFIHHHQPRNICKKHYSPSTLLIIVKSDATNIVQRQAIRFTWGNVKTQEIKLVFVLGNNKLVEDYVATEANMHGDILQGNFTDSYFHNTYKSVMAFNWIVRFCSKTPYLFFSDDDFFLNIPNIVNYLHSNSVKQKSYIYIGRLIPYAAPVRDLGSKWFIPFDEYANESFPPYLAGGSVLMTMNVATQFKDTFRKVRYIVVDDAYLGLVAKRCNIIPSHDERMHTAYTPVSIENLPYVFASHGFGNHRHLTGVWAILTNKSQLKTNLSKLN